MIMHEIIKAFDGYVLKHRYADGKVFAIEPIPNELDFPQLAKDLGCKWKRLESKNKRLAVNAARRYLDKLVAANNPQKPVDRAGNP